MNNKILLVGALSGAFLVSTIAPTYAFANSEEQNVITKADHSEDSVKLEAIQSMPVIDKYMKPSEDGKLYLDPASLTEVSPEVYEVYNNGVEKINTFIDQGVLRINEAGQIVAVNTSSPATGEGSMSTNSFGNFYGWGYALTLTNAESISLANSIISTGETATALSLILAYIPSPPTKLVQAITRAISQNVLLFGQQIRSTNRGAGVTLNFHYALYYTISPN